MDKWEPLAPILEKAGAFDIKWADLPRDLRRQIEERAPILASRGFPTAKAIAIVGNPTPPEWGVWQYSRASDSWIDLRSTSVVDDERAIVLPWPTKLRFAPRSNWFGTPANLVARLWTSTDDPPQAEEQDISASSGDEGVWSGDVLELAEAKDRPEGVFPAAQWATGRFWDSLDPGARKALVQRHDSQHDPAYAEQEREAFDLVFEIGDLARDEARLQQAETNGRPSEERIRREDLAKLREQRELKEERLRSLTQPVATQNGVKFHAEGVAQVRAVVAAINGAGKQLKRSTFDDMAVELVKPRPTESVLDALWRELTPEEWRKRGQGNPRKGRMVENWKTYLSAR